MFFARFVSSRPNSVPLGIRGWSLTSWCAFTEVMHERTMFQMLFIQADYFCFPVWNIELPYSNLSFSFSVAISHALQHLVQFRLSLDILVCSTLMIQCPFRWPLVTRVHEKKRPEAPSCVLKRLMYFTLIVIIAVSKTDIWAENGILRFGFPLAIL